MNNSLVTYLENIISLRDNFVKMTGADASEGYKIWARWIITHCSLFPHKGYILPSDDVYDYQIVSELINKGRMNNAYARSIYDSLLIECKALREVCPPMISKLHFYSRNSTIIGGIHGTEEIEVDIRDTFYVSCGSIEHEISPYIYKKLVRQYKNTKLGFPDFMAKYIWLIYTQYNILDGCGLQWAIPPAVMWILKQDMGCCTEIFASPLNAYCSKYYSLFHHDRYFGSLGNFFHAPDTHFISGTYQVNPPFIIPLFTKTTDRILSLLEKADKNGRNDLTFVYIMPVWDDFDSFNTVISSRFLAKHIVLQPKEHYYYYYTTGTFIKARFGTHIIILSTNTNVCSNDLEHKLINSFNKAVRY